MTASVAIAAVRSYRPLPEFDTARLIDTPEGVHLQLSPAGPVPRALAFAIDICIRAGVIALVALLSSWFGDFGTGLLLLIMFLFEWIYPVWFEVFRHGQTPGKKALRIRVVREDGAPVSWSASMVRNLLRVVDFFPLLYGFGLVAVLTDRHFRRLGDMAAGTMVVYDVVAEQPVALPQASPRRPPWDLEPQEQVALLAFAERSDRLNEARAAEIAAILDPIGGGGVAALRRNAAWLHGER